MYVMDAKLFEHLDNGNLEAFREELRDNCEIDDIHFIFGGPDYSGTLLHHLVKHDDAAWEDVEMLQQKGADIYRKDPHGWNVLHWAALGNNDELMQKLIEQLGQSSCNITESLNQPAIEKEAGDTPIIKALLFNNAQTASVLFQQGADLRQTNSEGESALTLLEKKDTAVFDNFLKIALGDGTADALFMLRAAKLARWENVKDLIDREECKCDVNELRGENGNTLLHYAAHDGHSEIVKKLLFDKDANPRVRNNDNETPLAYASTSIGNVKCIELLLKKDPGLICKTDGNGFNFLHKLATENSMFEKRNTIDIIFAVCGEFKEEALKATVQYDIEGSVQLLTAFEIAAYTCNYEMMINFLKLGALDVQTERSIFTFLKDLMSTVKESEKTKEAEEGDEDHTKKPFEVSLAAIYSHEMSWLNVKKMIDERDIYINFKNPRNANGTLLHVLCLDGRSTPILKLLIKNGALLNILDNHKKSPIHYLVDSHGPSKVSMLKQLLRYGAKINLPGSINAFDYSVLRGEKEMAKTIFELDKRTLNLKIKDIIVNNPIGIRRLVANGKLEMLKWLCEVATKELENSFKKLIPYNISLDKQQKQGITDDMQTKQINPPKPWNQNEKAIDCSSKGNALHLACKIPHTNEFMLENGLNPNGKNEMDFCNLLHQELIMFILDCTLVSDVKDSDGSTAMDLLKSGSYDDKFVATILELLQKRGLFLHRVHKENPHITKIENVRGDISDLLKSISSPEKDAELEELFKETEPISKSANDPVDQQENDNTTDTKNSSGVPEVTQTKPNLNNGETSEERTDKNKEEKEKNLPDMSLVKEMFEKIQSQIGRVEEKVDEMADIAKFAIDRNMPVSCEYMFHRIFNEIATHLTNQLSDRTRFLEALFADYPTAYKERVVGLISGENNKFNGQQITYEALFIWKLCNQTVSTAERIKELEVILVNCKMSNLISKITEIVETESVILMENAPKGDILEDRYLLDISEKLGNDWKVLGIRLGITTTELDNMQKDIPDQKMRGFEVLNKWKKSCLEEGLLKVFILVNALKECKRQDIVLFIQKIEPHSSRFCLLV